MTLSSIRREVISCQKCARLRAYCARIAREKRTAFRGDEYWGRPVPGFGDQHAQVLVLGLAPAAHGANRTGRVFTGDGSSDFLMAAMYAAGFANLETSQNVKDGLNLRNAYISAVVRCAPPDNKPNTKEIRNCQPYLEAELIALKRVKVVVALGKVAFDAYWRIIKERTATPKPRPRFSHGLVFEAEGVPALLGSYHPSRQNTNTGKLTSEMLANILETARRLATK